MGYRLFVSQRWQSSTLSLWQPIKPRLDEWPRQVTASTALRWPPPNPSPPPTTTTNERADSAGTAWKRKPLREKRGLHPHEQLFIWRAGKTQSGRQRSERGGRNCVWKWGQPHMHSMGPLNHLAAESSWNEAKIRNHPKAAQWFISSGSCRVKSQQPLGKWLLHFSLLCYLSPLYHLELLLIGQFVCYTNVRTTVLQTFWRKRG